MTKQQNECIYRVQNDIFNMASDIIGMSWTCLGLRIRMDIVDKEIVTKIGDKEFRDPMPMRGKRRNRTGIGNIVGQHMCNEWGGSLEEVAAYLKASIEAFFEHFGVAKEELSFNN